MIFSRVLVFICIILTCFISCSEDFKTGANYKEVMTVFGLLNQKDTAHYIKISKGFFDEKGNNFLAAKNTDSIYYPNLNVTIQEINAGGAILKTITLSKVDLKTEGYIKDTGIFANNPSYAYKFTNTLNPDYKYKLTVVNPSTGFTCTSETPILNTDPAKFDIAYPVQGGFLDFSDKAGSNQFFFTPPINASLVEMYLRFNYLELDLSGADTISTYKTVDIPIFTRKATLNNGGTPMLQVFNNSSFYGILTSSIGNAPLTIQRYVDTPDVVFFIGGTELKNYIDVTNAQGGLTADQIKPIYTNMQGKDVYGLLSTRGSRTINGLPFSKTTIDQLIADPVAAPLRIVGRSPI
jgi:hypothetical protein